MGSILSYQNALTEAMAMLAQHPKTIFLGQAVRYDGQRAHATFKDVPMEKRIEMPVCEDFQMGFSTGLALEGYIPISFYPRWDFLILAANQLINHLDKIPLLGGFRPKVIVRTAVGARAPLDPGPQHTGDYGEAFSLMLKSIPVWDLRDEKHVMDGYQKALDTQGSVILVERMELYK
jgi:pyruvate/2-oxoglutarate/acetoin dehydrogenase E1 component